MTRLAVALLALALLAAPLAAEAQEPAKVARIGYLAAAMATNPHFPEAFRQGLRDLDYVESRNVVIEYRSADGQLERLPDLAAELVRLKVDVLVSEGTPPSLAAKNATKTIPIVFAARMVTTGVHPDFPGSSSRRTMARTGSSRSTSSPVTVRPTAPS
jgi:ABC-type uncharacterized transport system substrate-binding protein